MAINISAGYKIGSKQPIDERLYFNTLAEMKAYDKDILPDVYFCVNKADGNIYIYNVANTDDTTTGKWRILKTEGNVVSVNDKTGKVVLTGTDLNIDEDTVKTIKAYIDEKEVKVSAETGNQIVTKTDGIYVAEGLKINDTDLTSSTTVLSASKVNTLLADKQDKITETNKIPYSNISNTPEIPTKTSDLTNDSNFVESDDLATVATSGNYNDLTNKPAIVDVEANPTSTPTAEMTKMKVGLTVYSLASGDKNVIEEVKVNGEALTPENKSVDITVPTKTSDLTNDSNFANVIINPTEGTAQETANTLSVNGVKYNIAATGGGEPNIIEKVKVNGTDLIVTNKAVDVPVPTTVAELTDATDYAKTTDLPAEVTANPTEEATTDLSKLKIGDTAYNIVGGDYNKIEVVKVNGTTQSILPADKSVNITVPTKASDLTNDSGYITTAALTDYAKTADVTASINTALAPYAKSTDVDATVDAKLVPYIKAEDVATSISTALSEYTKTDDMNAAINEAVTFKNAEGTKVTVGGIEAGTTFADGITFKSLIMKMLYEGKALPPTPALGTATYNFTDNTITVALNNINDGCTTELDDSKITAEDMTITGAIISGGNLVVSFTELKNGTVTFASGTVVNTGDGVTYTGVTYSAAKTVTVSDSRPTIATPSISVNTSSVLTNKEVVITISADLAHDATLSTLNASSLTIDGNAVTGTLTASSNVKYIYTLSDAERAADGNHTFAVAANAITLTTTTAYYKDPIGTEKKNADVSATYSISKRDLETPTLAMSAINNGQFTLTVTDNSTPDQVTTAYDYDKVTIGGTVIPRTGNTFTIPDSAYETAGTKTVNVAAGYYTVTAIPNSTTYNEGSKSTLATSKTVTVKQLPTPTVTLSNDIENGAKVTTSGVVTGLTTNTISNKIVITPTVEYTYSNGQISISTPGTYTVKVSAGALTSNNSTLSDRTYTKETLSSAEATTTVTVTEESKYVWEEGTEGQTEDNPLVITSAATTFMSTHLADDITEYGSLKNITVAAKAGAYELYFLGSEADPCNILIPFKSSTQVLGEVPEFYSGIVGASSSWTIGTGGKVILTSTTGAFTPDAGTYYFKLGKLNA